MFWTWHPRPFNTVFPLIWYLKQTVVYVVINTEPLMHLSALLADSENWNSSYRMPRIHRNIHRYGSHFGHPHILSEYVRASHAGPALTLILRFKIRWETVCMCVCDELPAAFEYRRLHVECLLELVERLQTHTQSTKLSKYWMFFWLQTVGSQQVKESGHEKFSGFTDRVW